MYIVWNRTKPNNNHHLYKISETNDWVLLLKVATDGSVRATLRYPSMGELSPVLDEAINIRVVEVRYHSVAHNK